MKKLQMAVLCGLLVLCGCAKKEETEQTSQVSIAEADFTMRQAESMVNAYLASEYGDEYTLKNVHIDNEDVIASYTYRDGSKDVDDTILFQSVTVNPKNSADVHYASVTRGAAMSDAAETADSEKQATPQPDKEENDTKEDETEEKESPAEGLIDFKAPEKKPDPSNPEDTSPLEVMKENGVAVIRVYAFGDSISFEGKLNGEGSVNIYVLDMDKKTIAHPVNVTQSGSFNEKAKVDANDFYYIYAETKGDYELSWAS